MLSRRFKEARSVLGALIAADPEDPAGYLYQAAAYEAEMADGERYEAPPVFYALLDSVLVKARRRIEERDWMDAGHLDALDYFYMGMARGFRSVHLAKKERRWASFRQGKRGVQDLKRAVELDSTLYDAYVGIGMVRYWKSRVTRGWRWLPWIKDERAQGIADLQLAAVKGRYFRTMAQYQLLWVFIHEGRYDEAIVLAQKLVRAYPKHRAFQWALAEALKHARAFEQALPIYNSLLASYEGDPGNNHYGAIECRRKIAWIAFQQGRYAETMAQCQRIASYSLDSITERRLKRKLQQTRQLLAKAREQERRSAKCEM